MKLFLITTLLFSTSVFAKINLNIEFDVKGVKSIIDREIELDKKQTQTMTDGKIEYILSNKRPKDYPSEYLWTEDSIHLEAKIFDNKGKIVSSPQITTLLGKTATMELSKENSREIETKIVFKPSKL